MSSSLSPLSMAAALLAKLSPRNSMAADPQPSSERVSRQPAENQDRGTLTPSSIRSPNDGATKKVYFSDDPNLLNLTPRSGGGLSRSQASSPNTSPTASGNSMMPPPPPSRLEKKSSVSAARESQMKRSVSASQPANHGNKLDEFLSQSLNHTSSARQRATVPSSSSTAATREARNGNVVRGNSPTNANNSMSNQHEDNQPQPSSSPEAMSPERLASHPSFVALRGSGGMSYRGRGGASGRMAAAAMPRAPPADVKPSTRFTSEPSYRTVSDQPTSAKQRGNSDISSMNPHFGSGALRRQSRGK
jgi:hypothetical protein